MASRNFVCKQFEITQQNSAMKVGTDSLILGSWAIAQHLTCEVVESQYNVLDIGCGTGLLTLMLAQKFMGKDKTKSDGPIKQRARLKVTAVEIDAGACIDAQHNFNQSDWAEHIQLVESSIQDLPDDKKFQRIICNPPYFTAGQSITQNRAVARLQTRLDWIILAEQISKRIASEGIAELVFPYNDLANVKLIFARFNLVCIAELHVYPKVSDKVPKRVCIRVTLGDVLKQNVPDVDSLIIYNELNNYTHDYQALCRHYYLNF